MLKALSWRGALLLMWSAIISAFLVGQVLAQTSGTSGTTTTTSSDPKTQCLNQNYKWCLNQDGVNGWCSYSTNYTCPAYTEADCVAQSSTNRWCKYQTPPSSGPNGWCSTSTSAPCPAYTEADCTAQSGKWCKPSYSGGTGWCAQGSNAECPINTEADCKAANRKWCRNSDGASGWCKSTSDTSLCPAYTEADCKAIAQTWCTSPYGGTPWCTSSCPYAQTTTTTTTTQPTTSSTTTTTQPTTSSTTTTTTSSEQTKCSTGGGKWCKNSDNVSGWCSYGSSPCPVYTESECTASKGEWCKYSSTASSAAMPAGSPTGWCNMPSPIANAAMTSGCPIYTKVECHAKSRTWCEPTSTSSSYTASSGWCQQLTDTYGCGMNYTAIKPDGTIVVPKPTEPAPVPPAYNMWPSNKSDCESYYGRWCESTNAGYANSYSTGWCQSGTKQCPPAYKPGYTSCWDGTQIPSSGTCPMTPTNKADCEKNGKYWCTYESTSAYSPMTTSGWCSSDKCMPSVPANYIMCPDGSSSAKMLSGCPKKGAVTPPPIVDTICPDGSVMVAGKCPQPPAYQCSNGVIAKSPQDCPKGGDDKVTECLNTGGVWCTHPSSTKTGYCAPKGVQCVTQPIEPPIGPPGPIIIDQPLPKDQVRMLEREKKNMVRELDQMERFYKRNKDEAAMAKVTALKEEIKKLSVTTNAIYEKLELLRDELENLRDTYRDAIESGDYNGGPERDEKFEKKALQQMKQGVKQFKRYLTTLEAKIRTLEKQGISVPQDLKDTLAKAKDMAARTEKATTYDEVRDIVGQMPEMAEKLNDFLPRLQQLSRLPRALKMIEGRLSAARVLMKETGAAAKRLKIDAAEALEKMQVLYEGMDAALANVKAGSYDGDDLFAYVDEKVLEPFSEIQQIANSVKSIATVQRYIGKVTADYKRFAARVAKLERAGEDVDEAAEAVGQLKEALDGLRDVARQKITPDVAEEILAKLQEISELSASLEELLGLTPIDVIEKQLRETLQSGGEELKEIEVDDLEKLIVKAYRTANFFRVSPYRALALSY